MEPIVISLLYYSFVIVFCEIGRRLVGIIFKSRSDLSALFMEAIGTMQICACVYENEFIIKYYGVVGFFCALFILFLINSQLLRASTNPLALIEMFYRKQLSSADFALRLIAQITGGILAFRFARLFWRLEMSLDHQRHFQKFFCSRELQVVMWVCVVHEILATFVDRSLVLQARQRLSSNKARLVGAFSLATISSIGLLRSPCKPVFTNPMLGSSRFIGCRGESAVRNIAVYWVGPLIGWICAGVFNQVINKLWRSRRKIE